MTATPTHDPEARCPESRIRKIDAAEARACLSRFVASHFRDKREHARFTIPADVNRDDDLLLGRFIDDAKALRTRHEAMRAALESAHKALAEVLESHTHRDDMDGNDCFNCGGEDGGHDSDCYYGSMRERMNGELFAARALLDAEKPAPRADSGVEGR